MIERDEFLIRGVLKEVEKWISEYQLGSNRLDNYLYELIHIFSDSPGILIKKLRPEIS